MNEYVDIDDYKGSVPFDHKVGRVNCKSEGYKDRQEDQHCTQDSKRVGDCFAGLIVTFIKQSC